MYLSTRHAETICAEGKKKRHLFLTLFWRFSGIPLCIAVSIRPKPIEKLIQLGNVKLNLTIETHILPFCQILLLMLKYIMIVKIF